MQKVLPKGFHLNGHTIGFHPQTQKLELHLMSSLLILRVKLINPRPCHLYSQLVS